MASGTTSSVRIACTPHASSGVPITQIADRVIVMSMQTAAAALRGRRPEADLAFALPLAAAERSAGARVSGWRHLAVGPDYACRNGECPSLKDCP